MVCPEVLVSSETSIRKIEDDCYEASSHRPTVAVMIGLGLTEPAWANDNDYDPGSPNIQCGSPGAMRIPGSAGRAPGSPLNPNGTAGGMYANGQHQNPQAVSPYDVACSK